jgi:hypothetical protein
MVRRGGLEPPRCYPLAPQANHRTRCHTIVSIYERVRGVIERDWGRQLAQKRHNLPSPQNGPSGPWVEPYLPKFWNHFRKGTKRRASRASAPLRSTGFGSHPRPLSPVTSCSNKVRCAIHAASPSYPNLSLRSCVHQGDASRFWFHRRAVPPKKSLRDFATLANLGHFTLRSA